MIHLVSPYVFHPSLRYIVKDVTRSCDHCLRTKPYSVSKSPPILRIQSQKPFEKVHIDILQLPQSKFGYKYVLNAVDQYSKWLASQPLKDKTSQSVANAFAKIVASLPSLPDTVISDNGREFIGEPFVQSLELLNIRHIFTTPYSPQSNGLVERVNRTLMGILTGLGPQTQWCSELNKAILTYNHTYHKELKCTPSECLTGLASKLPVRPEKKPFWKRNNEKFKPYTADSLVGYKRLTRSGVQQKLSDRYSGPYRVVTVNPNQKTYVIEGKNDPSKQYRAHHSQLRPWYNAPAYMQKSSMFLPHLNDPPNTVDHDTSTPEFVPGLKDLVFPSSPLPCRTNDQIEGMPIPEFVPGLSKLNFPPGVAFSTPVVPGPCPNAVGQQIPTSVPVYNVSTPISSPGLLPPVNLTPLSLSPVLPVPLAPLPTSSVLDFGSDNFSCKDMSFSSTARSSVFGSSSDSQFSGPSDLFSEPGSLGSVIDDFPGSSPHSFVNVDFSVFSDPHSSRELSFGDGDAEVMNVLRQMPGSPHGSTFSFSEQDVEGPAVSDAAVALRQLFPVSLSPTDLTFVSDSDLPSVSSNCSDHEYLPGPPSAQRAVVAQARRQDVPRRLTRNARAQICPDLGVDEALRRLQS